MNITAPGGCPAVVATNNDESTGAMTVAAAAAEAVATSHSSANASIPAPVADMAGSRQSPKMPSLNSLRNTLLSSSLSSLSENGYGYLSETEMATTLARANEAPVAGPRYWMSSSTTDEEDSIPRPRGSVESVEKMFPHIAESHSEIRSAIVSLGEGRFQQKLMRTIKNYIIGSRTELKNALASSTSKCRKLARNLARTMDLLHSVCATFSDSDEYMHRMSELVSIYVSCELSYAKEFKDHKPLIANRISNVMNKHLKVPNEDATKANILRMLVYMPKMYKEREVMTRIFQEFIPRPQVIIQQELPDKLYIQYLIVFHQWKRLETSIEEQLRVIEFANRFMRPAKTLCSNPIYAGHLPKYDSRRNATKFTLQNLKFFHDLRNASIRDNCLASTTGVVDLSEDDEDSNEKAAGGFEDFAELVAKVEIATISKPVKLEEQIVCATVDLTLEDNDNVEQPNNWLKELQFNALKMAPANVNQSLLANRQATPSDKHGQSAEIIDLDSEDEGDVNQSTVSESSSHEPELFSLDFEEPDRIDERDYYDGDLMSDQSFDDRYHDDLMLSDDHDNISRDVTKITSSRFQSNMRTYAKPKEKLAKSQSLITQLSQEKNSGTLLGRTQHHMNSESSITLAQECSTRNHRQNKTRSEFRVPRMVDSFSYRAQRLEEDTDESQEMERPTTSGSIKTLQNRSKTLLNQRPTAGYDHNRKAVLQQQSNDKRQTKKQVKFCDLSARPTKQPSAVGTKRAPVRAALSDKFNNQQNITRPRRNSISPASSSSSVSYENSKQMAQKERIESIKTVFGSYNLFRDRPSAPPAPNKSKKHVSRLISTGIILKGNQRLPTSAYNVLPPTWQDHASTEFHSTASSSDSESDATSDFSSASEGGYRVSYDYHLKNDVKLQQKCVVILTRSKEVDDYERLRKADAEIEKSRKELNQLNKSSKAKAEKESSRMVITKPRLSRKADSDKEGNRKAVTEPKNSRKDGSDKEGNRKAATQPKNSHKPNANAMAAKPKNSQANDKVQFYNTLLEVQRERLRRRAEERRRQHQANEVRRDEERRKQRIIQDKLHAENVLLQHKQRKAWLVARHAEEEKKSLQTQKRQEELMMQQELVRQRMLNMQQRAIQLESRNAALIEQKNKLLHCLGAINNGKKVAEPSKPPKQPKSKAVTKEAGKEKETAHKKPAKPVNLPAKSEEQPAKPMQLLAKQMEQQLEPVAQLVKPAVQLVKPAEQASKIAVQPAKHKRITDVKALRNASISCKEDSIEPTKLSILKESIAAVIAKPTISLVEVRTDICPPANVVPMKRLKVRLKRLKLKNLDSCTTAHKAPFANVSQAPRNNQPALPAPTPELLQSALPPATPEKLQPVLQTATPEPLQTAPAINAHESPNTTPPLPPLLRGITPEHASQRVLRYIDSETPTLEEFVLSGRVDKESQVDMDIETTQPTVAVEKSSDARDLVQPSETRTLALAQLESQTRLKAGETKKSCLREQLLGMVMMAKEKEQTTNKNDTSLTVKGPEPFVVKAESSRNVEENSSAHHSEAKELATPNKLATKHKKLKHKSRKRLGVRNNGQEEADRHEAEQSQQQQPVLPDDRGPTPLLDEICPPDACVFSVDAESEALPLMAKNPIEISNVIAAAASGLTLLANGLAPTSLSPPPPAQQVNLIEHSAIALPTPPEPPDVDANDDSPAFPPSLVALPQSSELPPMVEDQQSSYDYDYLSATQQLPAAIERLVVELKTVNNIMKDSTSTIALLNFEATPTVPAYLFNGESRDVPTPSPTPTPTPTSAAEQANSVHASAQEQEVSVDSSVSVSLPASSTVCLALSTSDHEVSSTQETIYELPKRLVTVKAVEQTPLTQDNTTMLVQNNQVDTTHHLPESSHGTRRRQYKNDKELDEIDRINKRRKTFCAESTLSPPVQPTTSSGSSPSTTTVTMEKPPVRRRGGRAAKNTATQQISMGAIVKPRQKLLRSISTSTPPPPPSANDNAPARGNCDSPGEPLPALSAAHIKRTYSKNNVVQKIFVPPEIEECLDSEADGGELVETTSTCNMPDTGVASEQRKCRVTPVLGVERSVGRKKQKTTSRLNATKGAVLRKPSSVKSVGGQKKRK